MPSPIPITLTMAEPAPYTSEDMFREPGTGRSLHDAAIMTTQTHFTVK